MKRWSAPRAQRHRSVPFQALDEVPGAGGKPINDSLVVLHRRALRHDQRNDTGACGRETVDSERALDDTRGEAGILEHRVVLADHLRGKLRPHAEEPRQFGFAPLGRHVVGHHRAERKGVDAALGLDRRV